MKTPLFTGDIQRGIAKIFCKGHLHAAFKSEEFLGANAFSLDGFWRIEITLKGGVMLLRYDSYDKWLSVLKVLNTLI